MLLKQDLWEILVYQLARRCTSYRYKLFHNSEKIHHWKNTIDISC